MISGLWHGASLTYVTWGAIHGLYQIFGDIFSPIISKVTTRLSINTASFSWKLFRIVKTFILVDIAWIFFRADTIKSALIILKNSLSLFNIGLVLNDGIYKLGLDSKNYNILFISLVALLIAGYINEKKIDFKEWLSQQSILFRYLLYWSGIILIILSLDITGQEFIYFQF